MGSAGSGEATYKKANADEDLDRFWKNVPLFKSLPKTEYGKLSSISEPKSFEKGTVLFQAGEPGSEFYVIRSGEAMLEAPGGLTEDLGPGDHCGEGALMGTHTRRATVTAKTALDTLTISRDNFEGTGLQDKITFPRRDKIKKRFQSMARGARVHYDEAVAIHKQRESLKPKRNWWTVQYDALKEIIFEPINMPAFIFVPAGQIVRSMGYSSGVVFATNFLAIIPLAHVLGEATEAISAHTGQIFGGLLNATFGNAVEMIMCVQAVKAGLITVVQGNLLGSILSNLLLVLGMAIFASGLVRHEQTFNAKGAASNMRCQLVASISVCLPTVFAAISATEEEEVIKISRISSVFLMATYGLFLFFMLGTHAEMFADDDEGEDPDEVMSPTISMVLLAFTTYLVFIASECLVDSIEDVSVDYGLSKAFIGVILLPIVGNAAEHTTAVMCAHKGLMDLALGVAVGSSTQIALFVVPCAVMCGWVFDQPMDLNFTVFDTTCQMLAVFLVSNVLSHGETNWLDGTMLMTVYGIIATQTLWIHNVRDDAVSG
jgi:Ca2+:H+ antiporter